MDLGFHLAMSYHYLKRPTSRKNFGDVVGQNHALILTQCLKFPLNLFVTYFHIPSFCFFVQTGQKSFRRCKDLVSDDILMRSIMVTRCEVDAPVVTPAPDFHFLTIQSFYDLLLYED